MIDAWWFTEHKNFGDELNPYIINKISGDQARFAKVPNIHRYFCIGSIIHIATDNDIVWGSGFINKDHHTVGKPKILAVRGPKTREILLKDGQECPEIYGDPSLLLPRYFNPPINKQYRIGIIPHYIDKDILWLKKFWNYPEIKIINIQNSTEEVISDILSCEIIFSSSLHGIIVADAYGIPAHWIKFHNRLGDFKFEDYLLSVGRSTESYIVTEETTTNDLMELAYDYKIDINLDKLYDCCPFKRKNAKLSVLICTIPSRTRSLIRLLYLLEKQTAGKPVEILFLGDNKNMSVGTKRNRLLEIACGDYVCFIDDDDKISEDYIDSILEMVQTKTDVITFDVEISENGSEYKKVIYDIEFDQNKNLPDHYERLPNHLMVVKKDLALKAGFPEKSFAEDHEFAQRLKTILNTQSRINKTLYYYDFDEKKSQTRD